MPGTAAGTVLMAGSSTRVGANPPNPFVCMAGTDRGTTRNHPRSPSVSGSPPRGNRNGPTLEATP